MHQFIYSIQKSVSDENWFSAIYMALTIPDICGGLNQRNNDKKLSHKERFLKWYEKYLAHKYTYLNGEAFWQLRCSVLHGGTHIDNKLQAALSDSELLVVTYNESPFHDCFVRWSKDQSYVFLRIDVFCKDVCSAIKKWIADVENESEIQSKIDKLFFIEKGAKAKEMIMGNVNLKWGQYSIQKMFSDIPARKGFRPLWENKPVIDE